MDGENNRLGEKGFTLVEMIAVLVLLGVVSALLVFRSSSDQTDVSASADKLKVHLRYAQMRAMNSDVTWGIQFNGGSYSLIRDMTGTPVTERLPGEINSSVSLPSAVTGSVQFDTWGRPSGLNTIGIGVITITITPDTGFIP